MGRMLEAIKQIEAKGPPPAASGMRPTLRRRSGSSIRAPRPDYVLDDEPSHWPAVEPAAAGPRAAEPRAAEPVLAEPPVAVQPVAMQPVDVPMAGPWEPQEVHRPGPSDQVRRVAAAMMGHVSALSSGVVALAAAEAAMETTAIAAALAEALAAGPKHEVLLVDARLQDSPGRLAEYWGGTPGLLDVLRRQTTWHETIRPTSVRGLSVLEAGTPGPQPPVEQWRILWSDLKRRFRFILLDGGPAISMSAGWNATVDAVYLLVELDRTARWAAEEAARHLQQSGARLAGIVLLDGQMRD